MPDEHVGTVTQALAPRKGRVTDLRPGDAGRTIVTFEAPARGLIGFRSLLLTATRGTALLHQHHAGWMPWAGELPAPHGRRDGGRPARAAPPATRSTTCSCAGELFVGPGEEVYEGMVVGENARADEMVVNVVRAKEKTNIRTHSHDDARQARPARASTRSRPPSSSSPTTSWSRSRPTAIRIRKRLLTEQDRRRAEQARRVRSAHFPQVRAGMSWRNDGDR